MSGDNFMPGDQDEEVQKQAKEIIERLKTARAEADKKREELERLQRENLSYLSSQARAVTLEARIRALVIFITMASSMVAVVNIAFPGILDRVFRDPLSTITILLTFILVIVLVLLPRQKRILEDTFLEIDRNFSRVEKAEANVVKNGVANIAINGAEAEELPPVEKFPEQSFGAGSDFEYSISEIVEYLGNHIKLAESKASKLLDKGTTYLRRGLYFYIGSIIIWQLWGHFVAFDALVITGMVSTSIAFIIIEFLAAWFLKQYRSFVDSSMAYMRVQSFFNRYLLLYYAARDFEEGEGRENLARVELLKALSQEIQWPDLRDVNANDFNYMIESMGSIHAAFEKLKSIVQPRRKKSR